MKRFAAVLAGGGTIGFALWHGMATLGGFPWSEIARGIFH